MHELTPSGVSLRAAQTAMPTRSPTRPPTLLPTIAPTPLTCDGTAVATMTTSGRVLSGYRDMVWCFNEVCAADSPFHRIHLPSHLHGLALRSHGPDSGGAHTTSDCSMSPLTSKPQTHTRRGSGTPTTPTRSTRPTRWCVQRRVRTTPFASEPGCRSGRTRRAGPTTASPGPSAYRAMQTMIMRL
jgi:hypothetical protein